MPLISRLLKLWAFGKSVSNTTPMFMRLLVGMAAITLLTVIVAVLVSLLLLGGLWLAYAQLVEHGMEPLNAFLTLGGIIILLIGAVILIARNYLRRIRNLSKQVFQVHHPVTAGVSHVVNAFIEGLLSPVEPGKR